MIYKIWFMLLTSRIRSPIGISYCNPWFTFSLLNLKGDKVINSF